MDTTAVQSGTSSLREITGAPQPISPTAPNSFESHFTGALKASDPTLDSKLPQNEHSSNSRTTHSTSQQGHVPIGYPSLLPADWNALDVMATSPGFNPSSQAVASQSPVTRTAPRSASGFETPGFLRMPGDAAGKTGASPGGSSPKTGSPENTTQSVVPKASDTAGSETRVPRSSSAPARESSQTSVDTNGSEDPAPRKGSSTEELAQNGIQMERALASLEGVGLSVLGVPTSAEAAPNFSEPAPKITGVSSVGDRNQTTSSEASVKSVSERPSPQDPSQSLGKGAQPSNGNGPSDAASARGDSPAPVKATAGAAEDNSRNTSSQDNSGRATSSASTQAQSAGNASGNGSSASAAAQAVATGFPQALNQAVPAANPTIQGGASTPPPASQAGAADKIAAALDSPTNAARAAVSSASLVQSQGKAEMHVAMQTDALGALQLHAVLDNGKLGASIQVVSHDAHTLLTNDLPALQQVLKDQNLRIDHLAVINSPMTSGAGARDGRGFDSEGFSQAGNQNTRWPSNAPAPVMSSNSGEALPLEYRIGRLSVRA
jgi:hypothetical protein